MASDSATRDLVLQRYTNHVNKSLAGLARLMAAPVESVAPPAPRSTATTAEAYLDCGGFGVFLLGHCHPTVVRAVRHQLETHPLATRLFLNAQQAEAAEVLAAVSPARPRLRLPHQLGRRSRRTGPETGPAGRQDPRSSPWRADFTARPWAPCRSPAACCTGSLSRRCCPTSSSCPSATSPPWRPPSQRDPSRSAVILEPVQAEGGVRLPPPGYLTQVRQRCTASGAAMILDEIQSGLGRLGSWWGAERRRRHPRSAPLRQDPRRRRHARRRSGGHRRDVRTAQRRSPAALVHLCRQPAGRRRRDRHHRRHPDRGSGRAVPAARRRSSGDGRRRHRRPLPRTGPRSAGPGTADRHRLSVRRRRRPSSCSA